MSPPPKEEIPDHLKIGNFERVQFIGHDDNRLKVNVGQPRSSRHPDDEPPSTEIASLENYKDKDQADKDMDIRTYLGKP